MNNFNDENEKVRDTVGRVMTDMGYFNNPVTINTPVGNRTFYERDDSPLMQKTQPTQQSAQYYIRDDKNYAWDIPKPDLQPSWNDKLQSSWNNIKSIANNFATATEATTVGLTSGASRGNFDEGMGQAYATITGNHNNYFKGRDATRKLQNNLQQYPHIYGVAEIAGATLTDRFLPSMAAPVATGIGYADNIDDIPENIGRNVIASKVAGNIHKVSKLSRDVRNFFQNGLTNYLLQDEE